MAQQRPANPAKPSPPGCEALGVLPRPAHNPTLALISRHAGRRPAARSHPSKVISSTNQAVKRSGCWRASASTAASGAHRQPATSPASALTGPSQLSSLVAASHVLAFTELEHLCCLPDRHAIIQVLVLHRQRLYNAHAGPAGHSSQRRPTPVSRPACIHADWPASALTGSSHTPTLCSDEQTLHLHSTRRLISYPCNVPCDWSHQMASRLAARAHTLQAARYACARVQPARAQHQPAMHLLHTRAAWFCLEKHACISFSHGALHSQAMHALAPASNSEYDFRLRGHSTASIGSKHGLDQTWTLDFTCMATRPAAC